MSTSCQTLRFNGHWTITFKPQLFADRLKLGDIHKLRHLKLLTTICEQSLSGSNNIILQIVIKILNYQNYLLWAMNLNI